MRAVFRETIGVELPSPFPVLTYDEAMRDYGTDKPDLRIPLKLAELTDAVKDVEFKVFSGPANTPGGRVCGAARSRRRRAHARRARRLWRVRQDPRRERTRLDQGQPARQGCRRLAVADRQEPARAGARCDSGENGGAGWRRHFLRRATRSSGRRVHGRAAREGRPRPRPGRERLAAAMGGGFPDVRARRGDAEWKARHHPFTSPKDGHEQLHRSRAGKGLRQGLRRGAERLGDRRRLGAHPPRRGSGKESLRR